MRILGHLPRQDKLEMNGRRLPTGLVPGKNTKPELIVRRLLHRMGYRFRLHRKDLPGSPDIVLPSRKKVVFVHGCFWHRHDCRAGRKIPQVNEDYWSRKFTRTLRRDQENRLALKDLGWEHLVIWECELKDLARVKDELTAFLRS